MEAVMRELTLGDLRDWAGGKILGRARPYVSRVQQLSLAPDQALVAWVVGTERYATSVRLPTRGEYVHACSCPYDHGGPCKHAVALLLAGPALAQSAAHSHDAVTPHKLSLNQGHKWAADEALRNGMSRIRGLVEPRLADAHAGKLTAAQYRELATQIETEVGGIVANCKLDPQADAQLHLVIAGIGEGVEAMEGKAKKVKRQAGAVKVIDALEKYGAHFEHAGWQPLAH